MKKTSTLGIIAIAALLIALVLTLIFGAGLWDVGGNGALQGLGGWLKLPMAIFTFLGDEQFYLLLVPLVYWCLNKELGADLGVLLVLSSFTNTALEVVLQTQPAVLGGPGAAIGRCQQLLHPQRPRADQRGVVRLPGLVPGRQTAGTPLGRPVGATHVSCRAVTRLPGRPFPR